MRGELVMRVIAKSAIKEVDLRDKLTRGAKYLELHSLEADALNLSANYEMLHQLLQEYGAKVNSVHVPITKSYTLENLVSEEGTQRLEPFYTLAQRLSDLQGTHVCIVLHVETSYTQLEKWGMHSAISKSIAWLHSKYPTVDTAIENVMLGLGDPLQGITEWRSGGLDEANFKIAHYLREELNTERVGVVFDTCHWRMSKSLLEYIGEKYPNYVPESAKLGFAESVQRQAHMLKVVHLANVRGDGCGTNHGCDYDTEAEERQLQYELGILACAGVTEVVLEVQETCYTQSESYSKLAGQVAVLSKQKKKK